MEISPLETDRAIQIEFSSVSSNSLIFWAVIQPLDSSAISGNKIRNEKLGSISAMYFWILLPENVEDAAFRILFPGFADDGLEIAIINLTFQKFQNRKYTFDTSKKYQKF